MFDPGPLTAKLTAKRSDGFHTQHRIHAVCRISLQRGDDVAVTGFRGELEIGFNAASLIQTGAVQKITGLIP